MSPAGSAKARKDADTLRNYFEIWEQNSLSCYSAALQVNVRKGLSRENGAVKDKAEQNAKPAVEFNDRTYFLLIDDASATREARQWVMQQYPDSEARVVAELRLHRLTERHTVIPIFKNGSIEQGSPVKVSDHWDQDNEESPVVVSSFVPAVAKAVLPCTVNYRSDSGTLRVRFS